MNKLTKIILFGELARFIGSPEWELDVKSVKEALYALNSITKNKFNDFFIKKNKLNSKYRILINGKDFISPHKDINEKNWEIVNQSELVINKNNLETIEIVPFIESSGTQIAGIFTTILAVILIAVGAILGIFTGVGFAITVAGIGLLGAGVVSLLSKPPPFNFNQNLDNSVSQSYLFNGPTNTIGEGNPIPIGYGTILVGSNVISAGYKITQFQTTNTN